MDKKTPQGRPTEREELRLSEARFDRAVRGSEAGIWEWNLEEDKVFLAPGFKHLLGYAEHELEDFLFREWLHPDDREGVLAAVHRSLETGQSFNTEYRLPHKSGEYRWFNGRGMVFFNDTGKPAFFTGAITDITERRRTQEILLVRNTALNAAANSIVITNPEGDIEWANPAFSRNTGYSLEEVLGKKTGMFKSGRQSKAFYQDLWNTIRSGNVWQGDFVNKRKDGTLFHEEETITPVKDENGLITHYIAVKQDISERKWAEEALHTLVASMIGITGKEYFDKVTRELCLWFGADGALIGELVEGGIVRSMSLELDGAQIENFEYAIADAPCEKVIGEGAQIFTQGVCRLFPLDKGLVEKSLDGYAGVPISNERGDTVGIVWIVSRRPLDMPSTWRDVMGIIAAKAGAEIERIRAQKSLESKSAYLDSILRSAVNMGIVATDLEFRMTYSNAAAEKLFDYDANRMIGRKVMGFYEFDKNGHPQLNTAIETVKTFGEYRYSSTRQKKDVVKYVDTRMSGIWDAETRLIGYVFLTEDVTDRKRDAETIERQASQDALTELPNRRTLLRRLSQEIARSQRHKHFGAVLFLDLDYFKNVNDSLGHTAGDELLLQASRRLADSVRAEDFVARLGGDEFVILLLELDEEIGVCGEMAQATADTIRKLFEAPFTIHGHKIHLSVSLGIALFPNEKESADILLKNADTAMYKAKESGRNTTRFFNPDMQKAIQKRLSLQNDLNHAIENQEFELYFQPQVDVHNEVVGLETLLRWNHSGGAIINPAEFISISEETGQIFMIGDWVLDASLKAHKRLTETYGCSLQQVSVNVSPLQFKRPDFVQRIENILVETEVSPACLKLELTENVLIENPEDAIYKMQRLTDSGVRFAIDDFGTGYSSLSYLRRLPVSEIKIDRSFVRQIHSNSHHARLVETILVLASHMGLVVVAEGVESAAELDYLKRIGCQFFQGFHFSRPLPENDLVLYLNSMV